LNETAFRVRFLFLRFAAALKLDRIFDSAPFCGKKSRQAAEPAPTPGLRPVEP
jgi:hypothetical protein